jgi:ATP-dependent DNA helicase RecG
MNMDFDWYLYSQLEDRETYDLEYKSAEGGFPGSFWDTYSSFANTQGGTVVLGVKEKHGNFIFDGLTDENINKYIKIFWDCANNKNHVSANILKEDDVEIKEYEGNKIVVFHIPRANRTQRPVYRTTNPYNGTFKRNDEGDYKCTEQEVRRMFADADDSSPKDSRILKGFTTDDIDIESMKQYRQLFASINSTHPWLVLDDLELLKKLGGYRKDRATKEEGFTVAGLLMFGKYESIIDNECIPNFFPDYREIPDEASTTARWSDRIYPDGTWEANLFQFYRKVLPKLTSVLPKPFKLENNIRIENTPTHIAVREAFINTLVHADYSAEGSLVITQRKGSYTFSNPGNMLISIAQYYQGGESVCRNRALQTMFMLIGSAEKAGSGVDKILAGWKEENWQRPYVEEKQRPDKVVLLLPMESLLPQANIDGLKRIYGDDVEHIGYNKLATLSICYAEKVVSNDRLKVLLPIHSSEITKMLKDLCNDGFLLPEGNGRGTTYTLKSLPKVDTSVEKVDTSVEKVDTSAEKVDTSAGKVDTPIMNRTHLKREELETLIISCVQDYSTLEDIAHKVNRDIKYLQNKVIPRMIQDQKIERLYPATPNHPNQKYKAKIEQ